MMVRSPPSGTAITAISIRAAGETSSAEIVVRVGASFGHSVCATLRSWPRRRRRSSGRRWRGHDVLQARAGLGQGLAEAVEDALGLFLDVALGDERAGHVDQAIGLGRGAERQLPAARDTLVADLARLPPDTQLTKVAL